MYSQEQAALRPLPRVRFADYNIEQLTETRPPRPHPPQS